MDARQKERKEEGWREMEVVCVRERGCLDGGECVCVALWEGF